FIVHRQRYIAGIHASYRKRLDESGVVLMPCHGRLLDAHTVVNADGVPLRAEHLLIATGGRPSRPDIPGAALGKASDDFFSLCAAPQRVAIVGGGYVAVELAGVLQALGSQVELFVRSQKLLDGFDAQITTELADDMRQHGVRLHFGYAVAALEEARDGGVIVLAEDDTRSERFDGLIFATGRRPNTGDMGLEAAGVKIDARGFVQVDAGQDTNVPGIHAVGDVTGQTALTPVAIAAARRLMDRVFGGQSDARLDYRDIATVVFSHPPAGKVGQTEDEARAAHGDSVKTYTTRFRPMLHALADSPQRSLFKLVCAGEEQRVVGIHLLGEGADEMLQGFAVALKKGITLADLHDTVAIHPTSAEEVVLVR
ncbi:MAG TPA: FAD-dependent oxidoreductase, partial [Pseudoxanthomonas sp.]